MYLSMLSCPEEHAKERRQAVGTLASEFPGLIRLVSLEKGKNKWKQHEFVPQGPPLPNAMVPVPVGAGPAADGTAACSECKVLLGKIADLQELLSNREYMLNDYISRARRA